MTLQNAMPTCFPHQPLLNKRKLDGEPLNEQLRQITQTHRSKRASCDHITQVKHNLDRLQQKINGAPVIMDGTTLEVADLVAAADYAPSIIISSDEQVEARLNESVLTLRERLDADETIYGVNTGFGGSADTRTIYKHALQQGLLQMQQTGILTSTDREHSFNHGHGKQDFSRFDRDSQAMPTSWVRASMVARCNSLMRGHSGVRIEVMAAIAKLLHFEITPIVPLRGSISASGDLSPLSYVAGVLEGNPDIKVRMGREKGAVTSASIALARYGIEPVVLEAKEGLGLLNGTAFSVATASMVIFYAQEMAVYAQILTAMGVEALQGTAESFDPRIAAMRPHPGQIESAANIMSFLENSSLAQGLAMHAGSSKPGLCQDRYALRTASQWIGPQLEDLLHAQRQLQIELNSTTDNPLIDAQERQILHGGNFQAAVVTSVMDRTRLALEKLGRMLFAQATEIINPTMNNGLPANLASDEPSLSFTCKGIDINMASYASELGFLANPVGNHVVSAEMHNQSLNSLGLMSSRYSFQALDVLRMMLAAYFFVACQALDLRVLLEEFYKDVKGKILVAVQSVFPCLTQEEQQVLFDMLLSRIRKVWPTTSANELEARYATTARAVMEDLVYHFANQSRHDTTDLQQLIHTVDVVKTTLKLTYEITRDRMYKSHRTTTPSYLGEGSRVMYKFVRKDLGLGFHRGLVEHPTYRAEVGVEEAVEVDNKDSNSAHTGNMKPTAQLTTIGTQISVIYEAIRDGRMRTPLTALLDRTLARD